MMLKLEIEKEKKLAYTEGYAEGYAEGFAKGYAEGFAKGYAEGLAESRIEGMKYLMKNKGLSAEAAMKVLHIPEKDFAKYMAML